MNIEKFISKRLDKKNSKKKYSKSISDLCVIAIASSLTIIIISGIVGIFLGDTLLFIALQKIGPRRNNILFSLAAPFTVVINIFFLNELASTISIIGCFVVFFGVVFAISYGDKKGSEHRWEKVEGSLYIGIILSIGAALCQAIGLVMMLSLIHI